MSRIYYHGKYFDYPLKADERAARTSASVEAVAVRAARTSWARIQPPKDQTTFEGWVASRFGWRLYRMFFKTYTEKVWGVPGRRAPGRLGGAAHQEPVARQARSSTRSLPEAEPEGDHLASSRSSSTRSTGPG